jgi:long-chain fatty acid transport protein
MTNPGGANVFWDESWPGRSRIISVSRRIYAFNLNGGFEVLPDVLRVGGGLLYYYGTQELRQGVGAIPGATAELGATGGGFSYHVAAEVTPLRSIPLVLGVDYKHKNKLSFEGDADFDVPPAFESPATQDQSVETDLVFPNQLNVGASYRPVDRLLLSLVWSFARFVEYDADTFRGETITLSVPRNYRNGYIIRGGAEYEATEKLTIRGGIMRDISGLRTETYSPTLPDGNTWGFALGGGWKFTPDLSLAATVFYALRDEVTSSNWASASNPTGSFPGTYETNIWIASVGVTWRTALLR